MGLRIDFLCTDGSPIGVVPTDVETRGVGGAELSLICLAREFAARGHSVRVINRPAAPGVYDGVEYLPGRGADDPVDVLVLFRSPNPLLGTVKAGLKVFWSCDQHTIGNFGRDVFPYVDRIVCISPYHVKYHEMHYHPVPDRIGCIDLGVRVKDYAGTNVPKIPGRLIFCSVPDRGLSILLPIFRNLKRRIPYVSLVITSDYRLWGNATPGNEQYRLMWLNEGNVQFLGAIPRVRLVAEQCAADILAYPSTYEELFCISAAECQVAGAVPVASDRGALPTTVEWGKIITGAPSTHHWQEAFENEVVNLLGDRDKLEKAQAKMKRAAAKRFDWGKIATKWEHLFETGEFI